MRILIFTLLFICFWTISFSQIATYSGISSTSFSVTSTQTGVAASNLVAGTGITSISGAGGCSSQPRLNIGTSSSWPTTQDAAYSLSFTITANTGYTVTISQVTLTQRRTNAGPTDINLQIGSTNNTGTITTTCQTPYSGSSNITLTSGQSSTITIFLTKPTAGTTGGNYDFNDIQVFGTALPVEFLSFDVSKKDRSSNIGFSTASETNNDYFTIERSLDGRDFEAIGEIKGAGNSTEQISYTFVDENPLSGVNYYRIKQTDFDGKYSYSDVKAVIHGSNNRTWVTPKNTSGIVTVETDLDNYELTVYSSMGQMVKKYSAYSGKQSVDISELPNGIYYFVVHSTTSQETIKVVKY